MSAADSPMADAVQPLLSVVKGQPSAEELAALTAVVLALQTRDTAGQPAARRRRRSLSRRELMRPHLYHGPGAWRHSSG